MKDLVFYERAALRSLLVNGLLRHNPWDGVGVAQIPVYGNLCENCYVEARDDVVEVKCDF